MEWFIVLIIIFIIASVLIKSLPGKEYSYQRRKTLFSAAERSFLGLLDQAVSEKYRVFGKVRVADILTPANGLSGTKRQAAFNRISQKHFDYVLCSKDKLEVIAVIELDDKSHNTKKTITRDAILEKACKSAELKLIRFKAKATYPVQAVREQIELALNS